MVEGQKDDLLVVYAQRNLLLGGGWVFHLYYDEALCRDRV